MRKLKQSNDHYTMIYSGLASMPTSTIGLCIQHPTGFPLSMLFKGLSNNHYTMLSKDKQYPYNVVFQCLTTTYTICFSMAKQ